MALAGVGSSPVAFFLSPAELATVDAITARILPTDNVAGAREAGVADYIQGLLSSLPIVDANCDGRRNAADLTAVVLRQDSSAAAGCRGADVNSDGLVDPADLRSTEVALFSARPVFAGGPFSGRHPYANFSSGVVTDQFPPPEFANALPLNRLQRLGLIIRLDGAEAVPDAADNPLANSLEGVDLRRKYREGIAEVEAMSQSLYGASFVRLSPAEQDDVLTFVDPEFVNIVTGHSIEGFLSDPEYGGNRDQIGWRLTRFDGDSQPLGYTLGFNEAEREYIERLDKPNSKPNPDEQCGDFSTTMIAFLSVIAGATETQPGLRFPNPFCFDVGT
jgi:hypothetical protein